MYVCTGTINYLYKSLQLPYELCGNLFQTERSCLEPAHITKGSTNQGRGTCTHKGYTPYIFHTHPRTSMSFPSREDIGKVLKRETIKYSLIFTEWGIWNLSASNHNTDETVMQSLYQTIEEQRMENDMYYISKHPTKYNQQRQDEMIQKYIQTMMSFLESFGFTMTFTRWRLNERYRIH
jgi:hypothetical protein